MRSGWSGCDRKSIDGGLQAGEPELQQFGLARNRHLQAAAIVILMRLCRLENASALCTHGLGRRSDWFFFYLVGKEIIAACGSFIHRSKFGGGH